MRFKKIYIEITNKCNLNCSFCSEDTRKKREMSKEEFEVVIKKIKAHTKYIYLHVKGEPFMHSNIGELLEIVKNNELKVNITTNGTLLKENLDIILKYSDIIRQINISVHSFLDNNLNNKYLDKLVFSTNEILNKSNIIISFRFWNNLDNKDNIETYKFLLKEFDKEVLLSEVIEKASIKVKENLYINKSDTFIWPNLNNDYYNESGKCYGLIKQVGILSDGTVVPCCLDSEGIIKLGNAISGNFVQIIKSDRSLKIIKNFKDNKKCEELCKRCNFLENKN